MSCNKCSVDGDKMVSWATVELINGAHERDKKRLWVVIIVLIAVLLATVGGFITYLSLYDCVSYEQDGVGNNIIGNDNRGYYYGSTVEDSAEEEP